MSAFLKTNTCSEMVHPFACAFWEEESRFAQGCPGDVYATVIDGPYVRGGVPPLRWTNQASPGIAEADGRGWVS
jgi:hypothetical protein